MKYFLIEKNDKTGEELSRIEYSSLRQMARDLKTTYCSCYANFLLNENPDNTKQPKKLSQTKFNSKYKIISA